MARQNDRLARLAAHRPPEPPAPAPERRSEPSQPDVIETPAPQPAAAVSPPAATTSTDRQTVQVPMPVIRERDRTRPVNLTWPAGFVKRFDAYCRRVGQSRSALSHQLLEAFLDSLDDPKQGKPSG